MTTQGFFKGKFNAADMAQTQQASTGRSHDYYENRPGWHLDPHTVRMIEEDWRRIYEPAGYIGEPGERCSWAIGNPALVMRIDGLWDVVAFAPYRRIAEGLSREAALGVVGSERATRELRDAIRAKTARSLRGLR